MAGCMVVYRRDMAAFSSFSSLTFFVHGHFQFIRRATPKVEATLANMKNGQHESRILG